MCPYEHFAVSQHGQRVHSALSWQKVHEKRHWQNHGKNHLLPFSFPRTQEGGPHGTLDAYRQFQWDLCLITSDPHSKLEASCLLEPGLIPSNCLTADWWQGDYVERTSQHDKRKSWKIFAPSLQARLEGSLPHQCLIHLFHFFFCVHLFKY